MRPGRSAIPVLASIAGVISLAASAACGDAIQLPTGDDTTTASGLGGGAPTTATGTGGGGPGQGGAGGLDGEGGGEPRVWVGLVANALEDGAPPSRADAVEATLATYAIGATIFATKRVWSTADEAGFAKDAELARLGCADPTTCRPAVLTIAVVDGLFDGRPEALRDEPWASTASVEALDASIDAALDAFGSSLAYLALGARVDRWLDAHPQDRDGLEELLAHAIDHAQTHPDARGDLAVGVGLSRRGALASTPPASNFRALGNATMTSLFPGLAELEDGGAIPSPGSVALDLDALDDVDPGRPVALIEVGYPSASEVGSDLEAQGLFFDALFDALESRRASFPLVVVSRLHDLAAEACAEEGSALGESDDLVLAYRCSTGARDAEDAPKPAWGSFVVGAATLDGGVTPQFD